MGAVFILQCSKSLYIIPVKKFLSSPPLNFQIPKQNLNVNDENVVLRLPVIPDWSIGDGQRALIDTGGGFITPGSDNPG